MKRGRGDGDQQVGHRLRETEAQQGPAVCRETPPQQKGWGQGPESAAEIRPDKISLGEVAEI